MTQPLRGVGPKGVGIKAFKPIGWEEALDFVADNIRKVAERNGAKPIWPYHNFAFKEGIGINALASADAAPPGGGAVFHDNAVWIRPTS